MDSPRANRIWTRYHTTQRTANHVRCGSRQTCLRSRRVATLLFQGTRKVRVAVLADVVLQLRTRARRAVNEVCLVSICSVAQRYVLTRSFRPLLAERIALRECETFFLGAARSTPSQSSGASAAGKAVASPGAASASASAPPSPLEASSALGDHALAMRLTHCATNWGTGMRTTGATDGTYTGWASAGAGSALATGEDTATLRAARKETTTRELVLMVKGDPPERPIFLAVDKTKSGDGRFSQHLPRRAPRRWLPHTDRRRNYGRKHSVRTR